jgi:small subunit ribosomal protein S16
MPLKMRWKIRGKTDIIYHSMAATIRLMRFGKRKHPSYRIVVIDKRKKRDGSYIEKIGQYNPLNAALPFEIDKEKYSSWISKGAQVSEGLQRLLKNKEISKLVA